VGRGGSVGVEINSALCSLSTINYQLPTINYPLNPPCLDAKRALPEFAQSWSNWIWA
jgi:hypothetical protein